MVLQSTAGFPAYLGWQRRFHEVVRSVCNYCTNYGGGRRPSHFSAVLNDLVADRISYSIRRLISSACVWLVSAETHPQCASVHDYFDFGHNDRAEFGLSIYYGPAFCLFHRPDRCPMGTGVPRVSLMLCTSIINMRLGVRIDQEYQFVLSAVYNLFFSPLANVPGPFLAKISGLPSYYHAIKGDRHIWVWQCLQIYGIKLDTAQATLPGLPAIASRLVDMF